MQQNYSYYFLSTQITTGLGIIFTLGIKYFCARPVIHYLEGDQTNQSLLTQALK
jgi:hypothetical protein